MNYSSFPGSNFWEPVVFGNMWKCWLHDWVGSGRLKETSCLYRISPQAEGVPSEKRVWPAGQRKHRAVCREVPGHQADCLNIIDRGSHKWFHFNTSLQLSPSAQALSLPLDVSPDFLYRFRLSAREVFQLFMPSSRIAQPLKLFHWGINIKKYIFNVQTYLGDTAGSVPDHHKKVSHTFFAGGGSCLQFVRNTTSVKYSKAKHNKMKYAYIQLDEFEDKYTPVRPSPQCKL